jgi:DNA-binding winged helix-turn-helix (wHTH) protein/Tfp pilus assembly protein PilF
LPLGLSLSPEFLWDFLKAMKSGTESAVYEFDGFRLDAQRRLLWNCDHPLALTPKIFDTLFYLVTNAGKTVSKDELMAAIWPDTVVEENNLNKNISVLRQLLREKPGEHRFIATVPGHGYRFVASVVKVSGNGIPDVEEVRSEGKPQGLTASRVDAHLKVLRVPSFSHRYWLLSALTVTLVVAGSYLSRGRGSPNPARSPDNVESHQLYLLGRYTALKLTPQDHVKAIEYFRQAIEKDPNYALAYTGITSAYTRYTLASDARPSDTMPLAQAAARKAIALNSALPEAHLALGQVAMFYDWNWDEAEQHFLRAYDLDPANTEGQLFLAHFYSNMAKHARALKFAERVGQLDPVTINHNALAGQFLYYAGRYDEAIESLRQVIELHPNHRLPRMFLARPYIEKGMFREALASCEEAKRMGSASLELVALEGWSYAKLGDTERANAALQELEQISKQRYVPSYFPALIHNALGHRQTALSLLEEGVTARDVRMTFLKVDPKWNNLRSEPRFIAIMQTMRFE